MSTTSFGSTGSIRRARSAREERLEQFRQFFASKCSIETVWAAAATGFDKSLRERLCAVGATTMALPESVGDNATLIDLNLVAEELGRVIAPVPWIDQICATRLGVLDPDTDAEWVMPGTPSSSS